MKRGARFGSRMTLSILMFWKARPFLDFTLEEEDPQNGREGLLSLLLTVDQISQRTHTLCMRRR